MKSFPKGALLTLLLAVAAASAFAQKETVMPTTDAKPEVVKLLELGYADSVAMKDRMPFFEKALAKAAELKDVPGQALSLYWMGSTCQSLDDQVKAMSYFLQADQLYGQLNNHAEQGHIEGYLGIAADALHDLPHAATYYEGSLTKLREANDKAWIGDIGGRLGIVYYSLSDVKKARATFEIALPILHDSGEKAMENPILAWLGRCCTTLNDNVAGLDYYRRCVDLSRELKNRAAEGQALSGMGECYEGTNDRMKAIEEYELALPVAREVKSKDGEAAILYSLGGCYLYLADYNHGIGYYDQALPLQKELGIDTSLTLVGLGLCYGGLEDKRSIKYLEDAMAIHRTKGDLYAEASALHQLGESYNALNQPAIAIFLVKEAMVSFSKIAAGQAISGGVMSREDAERNVRDVSRMGVSYDTLSRLSEYAALAATAKDAGFAGLSFNEKERAWAAKLDPVLADLRRVEIEIAAMSNSLVPEAANVEKLREDIKKVDALTAKFNELVTTFAGDSN